MACANDIIQFWFHEIDPSDRWKKSDAFDALIRERFTEVYLAALHGELFSWRTNAEGRLAEIIVLDQFPRNMFRDSAKSFASDPMALVLSQEAIARQSDAEMNDDERAFLYMPLMQRVPGRARVGAQDVWSVGGRGLPGFRKEASSDPRAFWTVSSSQ